MEFFLPKIKPIQEFYEKDSDQGVERIYLYYKKESINIKTDKQEVDIVVSPYWGKMLFLEDVLQSTTMDEVIYHNALVHPLLDTLYVRDRILILGGGEGATAREVLRWNSVRSVHMIDYDRELVECMKKYGNEWSKGAFKNWRLTVGYEDAWAFMRKSQEYNAIIIDLTDPDINNKDWRELLRNVMKSVKPTMGGFVMNAGLYLPWDTENLNKIVNMVKEILDTDFKYYIYTVFVPSFNGEWTFIVVAHKRKFMIEPEFSDVIPAWIKRGIKMLPDSILEEYIVTIPDISPISVISDI